jgi:hypothetical protein
MDYKMSDTNYFWHVIDEHGATIATYKNPYAAQMHVNSGASYGYSLQQGDLREPPEENDD